MQRRITDMTSEHAELVQAHEQALKG